MANLKEEALNYKAPETKNIAELNKIPVNIDIVEEEFTRQEDGEKFTIFSIEVDGEKYRVPKSVLKQLKAQLEENENLEFFKVKKEGSGMNTEYTVVPLV